MKQVKEMPHDGQFVAILEYNGKLWSSVHKWEDGVLLRYSEPRSAFIEANFYEKELPSLGATYFTRDQ